jgi:two-component system response regulator NreC
VLNEARERPVSIRVVVVDRTAGPRRTSRLDADARIDVVGEAESVDEAAAVVRRARPDVVVLVWREPAGPEAVRGLCAAIGDACLVVLSPDDDLRSLRDALYAGARGYVLAPDDLGVAVHEVVCGARYVDPALGAALIAAEAADRRRLAEDPLSAREREVLRLLALGHTTKEIAQTLFISARTVQTHRAHVMAKLKLSTRAELVRHAQSRGMFRTDRI